MGFDEVDPPTITVAGHGSFDFPAEMTPDQIRGCVTEKVSERRGDCFPQEHEPEVEKRHRQRQPILTIGV